MSGEYNFDEVITPSLTLEPELEPVVETTLVAQPEKEDAEGPVLTPEEQAMVAAFAEKIDVDITLLVCETSTIVW